MTALAPTDRRTTLACEETEVVTSATEPLTNPADQPVTGDPPSRPVTRADCFKVPRPCLFAATCRYGLPAGACALDAADGGPMGLDAVGAALGGLGKEGVRNLQRKALERFTLRAYAAKLIERLPRAGEHGMAEHPFGASPPASHDDHDPTDEPDLAPRRGSMLDFRPGTDEAACDAIWTMLEKRRGGQ